MSTLFLLSALFLFLSEDGIVSFLKKQAGPASVELKTNADFEKFIADQDASVIGEWSIFLLTLWK